MTIQPGFQVFAGAALAGILLGATPTDAADLHVVDPEDPAAFAEIQPAIDAAANGDLVLVMPGIYTGQGNAVVDFKGKDVSLIAWGGPEQTFIDGESERRGFLCTSGETEATTISGFTIMRGMDDELGGGGMYLVDSAATITGCHFLGNQAVYEGGAVKSIAQAGIGPLFINCLFSDNRADHWLGAGGAAYLDGNGEIRDCRCRSAKPDILRPHRFGVPHEGIRPGPRPRG